MRSIGPANTPAKTRKAGGLRHDIQGDARMVTSRRSAGVLRGAQKLPAVAVAALLVTASLGTAAQDASYPTTI